MPSIRGIGLRRCVKAGRAGPSGRILSKIANCHSRSLGACGPRKIRAFASPMSESDKVTPLLVPGSERV